MPIVVRQRGIGVRGRANRLGRQALGIAIDVVAQELQALHRTLVGDIIQIEHILVVGDAADGKATGIGGEFHLILLPTARHLDVAANLLELASLG